MSFTAFTNIITILFCLAVLIQSVRMMRSLNQVRYSELDSTVGALDAATTKAREVLSEMKEILTSEAPANAQVLGEARKVREELDIMVGIANAMAERLIEAASAGSRNDGKPMPEPAELPRAKPAAPKRNATSRPSVKGTKAKKSTDGCTANHSENATGVAKKTTTRKTAGRSPRKSSAPTTDEKEFA
tara:strand:+ start:12707 stop:13270 length:564 start_codon:yes stop_codon:yes gene_type:complete